MSSFTFSKLPLDISLSETIKIGSEGLFGRLLVFSGEQGEFWVSIVPSLNVSGYGKTENEANESLQENLHTFCKDLFSVSEDQRKVELKKMGWVPNKLFKKKYAKAIVDENGVLQHFDHPEQVIRKILEAA
jgi:predicted RNase H-like HicB family nuclease